MISDIFAKTYDYTQSFQQFSGLSVLAVACACAVIIAIISRVIAFRADLKTVRYIPGWRSVFGPFHPAGILLPSTGWNPGLGVHWKWRFNLYSYYGRDTISIVPVIAGGPMLWTSNLSVMRQIVGGGSQSDWHKPVRVSRALMFWGMNLIATEGGEQWRRHRRIIGAAFNQELYEQVWNNAMRIYDDMLRTERWTEQESVTVRAVQDFSFKFALSILVSCGFGTPFPWSEPPIAKDGSMSIQEALRINTVTGNIRLIFPDWVRRWVPIKLFKDMENAYRIQDVFMREQVEQRKTEIRRDIEASKERHDIFSRLVCANELMTEKYPLDDDELIGNVYGILVAGHETTGHTLAVCLGLLGLYQEEQELVYQNIVDVVGYEREPQYEDYAALNKVLAVFYEGGRLYPSAHVLIREAKEDAIMNIPAGRDEEVEEKHAFDKGTLFVVDMIGLQYNPKYFPEPNAFRPSRWWTQDGVGEPEGVNLFSIGPRACVGRKFATTEAVAFLTVLLRDWRIDVDLEPGETREQWRERVMQAKILFTLSVNSVPIRLTRRKIARL